jgi:hypothetical protein
MGVADKIKEIEDEMNRTQKNKATEHHLGRLKAQLAKLRRELLEGDSKGGVGKSGLIELEKGLQSRNSVTQESLWSVFHRWASHRCSASLRTLNRK